MKERDERLNALRQIIRGRVVSSQEELLSQLLAEGFELTQATLSRDLKALRVGKVSSPGGTYAYVLPEEEDRSPADLIRDLQRGYLSMEDSDNLVVLKTLPGHAQAAAWALDNLSLSSVLGTVAGDDTILIILKSGRRFPDLRAELAKIMPGWEV
jgi:transcriptional regulator of arginine metabolism